LEARSQETGGRRQEAKGMGKYSKQLADCSWQEMNYSSNIIY
jgi:hypothetical protein